MSNKNSVIRSIIKSPMKSDAKEDFKSKIKLKKRVNTLSNKNQNKYNLTASNSVQKGNVINSIDTSLNKEKINQLKSYLPYIPNKERQKAEDDFIDLIKAIINSRNSQKKVMKNISIKNYENDRYRPRGYGYFEYIREHPLYIKQLDQNSYSKIIHDINKNVDSKQENYKRVNIMRNDNRKEISLVDKKNNLTETDIFANNNNLQYFQTQNNNINNIETMNNNNLKRGNLKININNNNKGKIIFGNNNRNNILPSIGSKKTLNQKDFHKSDIFYLVDDDLSKEKTSEQYLFKPNYSPMKLGKDKKTTLNEVGWSPKMDKNKSRIGCSSCPFNIINPSLKSLSPMKKEIDKMNNNNFEKPPLISDYINMCKPGDTRLRRDFSVKLDENKGMFHRKNYCASYSDLYHEYKYLVNSVF